MKFRKIIVSHLMNQGIEFPIDHLIEKSHLTRDSVYNMLNRADEGIGPESGKLSIQHMDFLIRVCKDAMNPGSPNQGNTVNVFLWKAKIEYERRIDKK